MDKSVQNIKNIQHEFCQCSDNNPVLLNGSKLNSPLICTSCKKAVSLENINTTDDVVISLNKWAQVYHSLFTLGSDSTEYRDWAKKQLLDEIGAINIEGLELAQKLNANRKTYYWMFQDNSDKKYIQPKQCPFCGASMETLLNNDFKVCHPCKVAYPDKK